VEPRARLVLVLGLCEASRLNFNLYLLLSPGTVRKAAMATTMDVDGIALGQSATLHGLPQVQEHPVVPTGLPLSNGRPPIAISTRFGLVTVVLLVWTRPITQAPRIANLSEKSLSKYTFGDLTETPGCTWGVRQFRWTHRDIPLKSVSQYTHLRPTQDRPSERSSQLSARPQRIRYCRSLTK